MREGCSSGQRQRRRRPWRAGRWAGDGTRGSGGCSTGRRRGSETATAATRTAPSTSTAWCRVEGVATARTHMAAATRVSHVNAAIAARPHGPLMNAGAACQGRRVRRAACHSGLLQSDKLYLACRGDSVGQVLDKQWAERPHTLVAGTLLTVRQQGRTPLLSRPHLAAPAGSAIQRERPAHWACSCVREPPVQSPTPLAFDRSGAPGGGMARRAGP